MMKVGEVYHRWLSRIGHGLACAALQRMRSRKSSAREHQSIAIKGEKEKVSASEMNRKVKKRKKPYRWNFQFDRQKYAPQYSP